MIPGSDEDDMGQYWYCINEAGFLSFADWQFKGEDDEIAVKRFLR